MKLIGTSSFLLSVIALAAGAGCGGSSGGNPGTASDAGGGSDTGVKADAGGTDGGAESIAGSMAITVTVLQNMNNIVGMNTPFNNCGARIEVPGNSKAAIETLTNSMGVATFMVDPSKGPFDVTVANAGVSAVSILGVTAPIAGNVILYSVAAPPTPSNFTATGTITGKQADTNQVQLDAWDWQTVATSAATYSTSFSYTAGLTTESPLPVAAMEENDAGQIVNGLLTASIPRMAQAATIDIAFPAPVSPTVGTVMVNWPASGFNAGSTAITIANADPSAGTANADMYLGNGLIEQTIATEPGAGMYCGRVDVTLPVSNVATMTIQSYGGNLAPSLVTGAWTSIAAGATGGTAADYETFLYLHSTQLAGGTVTLPAIRSEGFTFTGSAMTLDTTQFAIDSDYATAAVSIADTSGTSTTTLWTIYSQSGTVAARGLPHLPKSLMGLGMVSGDTSTLSVVISAANYAYESPGATAPWNSISQDLAIQTNTFAGVVSPAVGTY